MKPTSGRFLSVWSCLLLAACGATDTEPSAEDVLSLGPCPPEERIPDGMCGSLSVFEDPGAEDGGRVDLRIVVFPALSSTPAPDPFVVLAGGPGQAATEIGGTVLGAFRGVHRSRDVVLVDQRGTGGSSGMSCSLDDDDDQGTDELLVDPMADSLLMAQTLIRLRECADSFLADPRFYTTDQAVDDLNQVLNGLGYDAVNLWGVSYGTRVGLEYMRRYPNHVRTAVLDGLAPPSIKLPLHMGEDGSRALNLMLEDCRASEACNAAFPDLESELSSLLGSLGTAPVETRVDHPRTGVVTDVVISRTSVASVVRATLYSPQIASLLPLAIHEAARGRFEPLAALSLGAGGGDAEIYVGMFLSVICAEDVPFITEADRMAAASDPLFGTSLIDSFRQMCSVWPAGEVPESYTEPVHSDVPTLLLSGQLDPVTPPRWGELVGETLSDALHIVVPGTGHNAFASGCLRDLIESFIEEGSLAGLEVECAEEVERPRFFDTALGPDTGSRQ
ncbi:MAG: alpha/beta hydrolase [Longimicrobiales bacterium]